MHSCSLLQHISFIRFAYFRGQISFSEFFLKKNQNHIHIQRLLGLFGGFGGFDCFGATTLAGEINGAGIEIRIVCGLIVVDNRTVGVHVFCH